MLTYILTIGIICCHYLFKIVECALGRQCNDFDLRNGNQCDSTVEICDKNICQCRPGFAKNQTHCISTVEVSPNSSSLIESEGGSHVLATIVPIFILIILVSGVYVHRKYNVINWVVNKINQRRIRTYDEFIIGGDTDDDPPLR